MAYCIDLKSRNLKIELLDGDDLAYDLNYYKVKKASDLDMINLRHKVFDTLDQASAWLYKYEQVKKSLNNKTICQDLKLPTLRMTRNLIVMALMGEKTITERKKGKNWKSGQLFNIFDQTFYMTVKLKKIEKINSRYIFHFIKA
jgi:hypothetical protein